MQVFAGARILSFLVLVFLLLHSATAVAGPRNARQLPAGMPVRVSYAGTESIRHAPLDMPAPPATGPAAIFTVSTLLDTGAGSLRRAIQDANASPGLDRIHFAIPGTGVQTIRPRSALPTIVSPVVIDGSTQNGYTNVPRIVIDGNDIPGGAYADGLTLDPTAAGSTIRAIAVTFFPGNGILIFGANNTVVEGCYIGYDPGSGGRGNAESGIFVQQASACRFGGPAAAQRNVICSSVTFGIILRGLANNDTVQGNYIGIDPSGSLGLGNGYDGVRLNVYSANGTGASNCLIGGTTPGERNVISGNDSAGVGLFGQVVTNNIVTGNYIGTNPAGANAIPNGADGVRFWSSATASVGTARNNRIGGTTPAGRNVISGNMRCGVFVSGSLAGGSDNVIIGNYIGTNATGTLALGNGWHGVLVTTLVNGGTVAGTRIGGGSVDSANVISANRRSGVSLEGAGVTGTTVRGNLVGLSTHQPIPLPLGNDGDGIQIMDAPGSRIGGITPPAGNLIGANGGNGIRDSGSVAGARATIIQGNLVGTTADGQTRFGNGLNGVLLRAVRDTVGGNDPLGANVIAFNRRAGVAVEGGSGNLIRLNRIYDNDSLGIDLGPNGITPNDSLDADAGGNGLQNFPHIDSMAVSGGTTRVYGSLMSRPGTTYALDFFMNRVGDTRHFGEGRTYIGSAAVTTGATGVQRFTAVLPVAVPADSFVAAVAVDDLGNTSEFSQAFSWDDRDGDGIYTHWETQGWGMDVNSDGVVDLDLYARGARPLHKDLFLEVDGMAGYDVLPGTRELVINAFATVPDTLLHNPDGAPGIALHITPFDDQGVPARAFPAVWVDFDQFKNTYFGTPGDRASANRRYILEAKKLVFRYCVFGFTFGTTPDELQSSGLARGIVARDLMVTFGGWTSLITQAEQAGTLMHELGHTLGLRHGGGDDRLYKPNYYSVMNYTWQVPYRDWQAPESWTLDYSRAALPPLNEDSLDERVGLNPPAGAFRVVSVPYTDPIRMVGQAKLRTRWAADWNRDGSIQAAPVAVDLNRLNNSPASPGETLIGFSDWSNLVLNFRPTVTSVLLDPSSVQDVGQELTFSMYNQLRTLPPPRPSGVFRMDGVLDSSAVLLTRNGSTGLYAAFNEGQLYVATEASAQNGSDIVLTISDGRRALRAAPRGKAGQVAGWSALVWNQPSGNISGWTDAVDSALSSITVDSAGTLLEGVIDVEYLFGSRPPSVFLAVGRYQPGPGGSLAAQAPAGNGDGNIDPGELFELDISGTSLSGVKVIDTSGAGDYRSFAAAIADLNTRPLGSGGITFEVTAGQVFDEPPQTINPKGSSTSPIVFRKAGTGPNPVVRGVNGTLAPTVQFTNGDAIFRINGADYVTFDGIDVTDHPSNTNATQRMEYGFLLTRADSNDGCKNVTLKNLTVRLRWTTARGAGIAQVNFNGAGVTKNPTGRGGLHENLDISGCTISDVPVGIALAGYNDPVRPRLYDENASVGASGGNTITGFAGNTADLSAGVYMAYNRNPRVANNTIVSSDSGTSVLYGILGSEGEITDVTVENNTVTMLGGPGSPGVSGIFNRMGFAPAGYTTTVRINGNAVRNSLQRGQNRLVLIASIASSTVSEIRNNRLENNRKSSPGSLYGIYGGLLIQGNMIRGNRLDSAGTFYGIEYFQTVSGNVIDSNVAVRGDMILIYPAEPSKPGVLISRNRLEWNTSANRIQGIQIDLPSVDSIFIERNRIHGLSGNPAYGLRSLGSAGPAFALVSNNFISGLQAPQSTLQPGVFGLGIEGGTTIRSYYNTILLDARSTSTTTFGSAGIYVAGGRPLDLRNTIVVNTSVPGPTGGFTAAYQRATAPDGTYNAASNFNNLGTGAPRVRSYLYVQGANRDSTIAAYRARMAPRDSASVSVAVSFVDSARGDLHLGGASRGDLRLKAAPIPSVTIDIDGHLRHPLTPYMGADEDSSAPLPITLSSFTGRVLGGNRGVRLDWTTLSEVNNYGFLVQRRSRGDSAWTELPGSFQPGGGTTHEPRHYAWTDSTVRSGAWSYRLKQIDLDGTVWYSDGVEVTFPTSAGEENLPTAYALHQNYPNPFNPSTRVGYDLPDLSRVSVRVYDLLGRTVATLVDGTANPGRHVVEWRGRSDAGVQVPSGVYFLRMDANAVSGEGHYTAVRKMIMLK